jgi:endonuclease YncB( thermonuclease family)
MGGAFNGDALGHCRGVFMANLRIGTTTWLLAPAVERPLRQSKHLMAGTVGRTVGLTALALGLGFTAIASATRADQPNAIEASADATPSAAGHRKDAAQGGISVAMLFGHGAVGSASRFTASGSGILSASSFAPRSSDWTEREFPAVTVVDGRTLEAGDIRIRLIGLDLPMPEQVCRTLDGRLERCVARAATQLELLTRWKRVTCQYRLSVSHERIGRCRIGTSDLTDRMVMTGYAWRSAAPAERS